MAGALLRGLTVFLIGSSPFLPNQIDQAARQHHVHLARNHRVLGLIGRVLGQCLIDFKTDLFAGLHAAFDQVTFD
jgi:hypothetical protein